MRLLCVLLTLLVSVPLRAQCVAQSAAALQRLTDSLQGRSWTVTLLDSAGIRVTDTYGSPGVRADGSIEWCLRGEPELQFARARIVLLEGERPALVGRAEGMPTLTLLAIVDEPALSGAPYTPEGTAKTNFGFGSWQAAVVALAPRFHSGAPVVVLPPPVISPPGPQPQLPRACDGHPEGFAVRTGGSAYTGLRTERVTIVRGDICLGVTTLASAARYAAHIRTGSGWRTLALTYTSRASAEAAVVAAGVR